MSLIDHLQSIASAWSEQTGRSLARLSTIVLNDGKFFDRLAAGKTCTVDSYERFVGWLADPANWPDAMIPDHVRPLLPVADTTPKCPDRSPENDCAHFSHEEAA